MIGFHGIDMNLLLLKKSRRGERGNMTAPIPESMETWHSERLLFFSSSSSSVVTCLRGTKQLVKAPATRFAAALKEPLVLTWEERVL